MKHFFVLTCVLACAFAAHAQTSETSLPAPTPTPASAPAPVKEETLQFSGDFRYRHQVETQGSKEQRTIERIQARFGVASQLQDNFLVKLRLMTGSAANSGNQTLGDSSAPGMPRRNFGLDQAYFDYQPLAGLNLYGGKMPQPFTFAGKNQLLLDRDLSPEGGALKYSVSLMEELKYFVHGGSFLIRENYNTTSGKEQTDNLLNALQTGVQWKPEDWTVLVGVGSFAYIGLKNTSPGNLVSGSNGNGNTLDGSGNYASEYNIEEMFLELQKKVGTVDLTLFVEGLRNREATTLNRATSYGILAAYKAWSFGLSQQEVQKDAVVGAFTDSDFGGGGTSVRGQVWTAGYKLTKKIAAQLTVFKNQTAIDTTPQKYDRANLDLMASF